MQARAAELRAALGGLDVRVGLEDHDGLQQLVVLAPDLPQVLQPALIAGGGERREALQPGLGGRMPVELAQGGVEAAYRGLQLAQPAAEVTARGEIGAHELRARGDDTRLQSLLAGIAQRSHALRGACARTDS